MTADAQHDSNVMDRIEETLRALTRPVAFAGVIGMLIVAGFTLFDVTMRWVANSPLAALNEVYSTLFAVAIAACLPSGFAHRVNLKVDFLTHWIAGRLASWLESVGSVLLLVFVALLTWRIGVLAGDFAEQGRVTIILNWPQAPFLYAVSVLFGAGTLVQAVVALNSIRRSAKTETADAPDTDGSPIAPLLVGVFAVATLVVLGAAAADFDALSDWALGHGGAAVAIAFVLVWGLLLGFMPLAAAMGLIGLFGTALFIGVAPALSIVGTESSDFLTNSLVAVLPLFMMMGSFAAVAGLADDIYQLAHAALGRFRGGLALATIGGCAGFGAVTGSSIATVATIGRVALPQMRERGYSPSLSTGCVAAGGTLGQLVPPSAPIVIFALLTEASIGQLFVAALVPALIAIAFYLITIMAYVRLSPSAAPPRARISSTELVRAFARSSIVIALFAAVIGGLYTGVFTATESAAVGAFSTFLIALARGRLKRDAFWRVMAETTATTAMVYGLIFGALIFSYFVGVSGLPEEATRLIGGANLQPIVVVALLLAVYILLGSIMDSFAILVITVPVVTPLILNMGYDLVWWGIIMVVVVETGLISPPFGLNVFVLKSLAPDVPLATVFRGVLPFVAADIVKLVVLVALPATVVWLPSTMFK